MNLSNDQLKTERDRIAAAFDPVLKEPVPDRLKALLAEPAPVPVAQVLALGAARIERVGMSSWAAWGGMAATLVLGTLIGTRLAPPSDALAGGALLATGAVAQALDTQLASAPQAGAAVAVQLSFKTRDGRYCRSFTTTAVAGLACHKAGGTWALQQVATLDAAPTGDMRQAASGMPPAVLAAIDASIAGEALDAEQERAARDAGWRR